MDNVLVPMFSRGSQGLSLTYINHNTPGRSRACGVHRRPSRDPVLCLEALAR